MSWSALASFILLFFLNVHFVFPEKGHDWGYEDTKKWCELSDTCCGQNQSPIDLSSSTKTKSGAPFKFEGYDVAPKTMKITNNGHTIDFAITSDDVKPRVSGGKLGGSYNFAAFHFHWGDQDKGASEHTLDGKPYDMELHLVHYKDTYKSVKEALESNKPDALAVLGVWLKSDKEENKALNPLNEAMKKISYKGESNELSPGIALNKLLPKDINQFYRYMGSLTTPTCNEAIQWTVFKTPIPITKKQMKNFRLMFFGEKDKDSEPMENNFRPVQPLNDRPVTLFSAS